MGNGCGDLEYHAALRDHEGAYVVSCSSGKDFVSPRRARVVRREISFQEAMKLVRGDDGAKQPDNEKLLSMLDNVLVDERALSF